MTNAFDYSGPSIWTKDHELKKINHGKQFGAKRREELRKKEVYGVHVYQAKKNKK